VLSLRGDPQIATEHLLLGLVEERDGPVAAVLERGGVDRERVRQRLLEALSP
jgi:ATP-dependent Clp protease ATP-binding subunit ClpA